MFESIANKPAPGWAFVVVLTLLWGLGMWNVGNLYGDVEKNNKTRLEFSVAVTEMRKDIEATREAVNKADARVQRLETLIIDLIRQRN